MTEPVVYEAHSCLNCGRFPVIHYGKQWKGQRVKCTHDSALHEVRMNCPAWRPEERTEPCT